MVGKLKKEDREKIILEKLDRPKTLHELKYEILLNKETLRKLLNDMVNRGIVAKDGFKYYRVIK